MSSDNQQNKRGNTAQSQENINDLPEQSLPERDAQTLKGGAARSTSPMDPLINTAGRK